MKQFSLIEVQQEYIDTVNAGILRWLHRRGGGHCHRITRGATNKLEAALMTHGFTPAQTRAAIKDARDMAELERNTDAGVYDELNFAEVR